MSMEIPPSLGWVANLAVGDSWPQGDEDKLRALGEAWEEAAQAMAAISHEVGPSVNGVLAGVAGPVLQEFVDFVEKFLRNLPQMAQSADQLSKLAKKTAVEVQYAKYMILLQLAWIAVEIAQWILYAPAVVPAIVAAGRVAVRMILRRLLVSMAMGIGMMLGMDAAVQGLQMLMGDRTEWNVQNTLGMLKAGAIGGAIGGATFGFADAFVPGAQKLIVKLITGGAAGVATTVVQNALLGGHSSIASAFTSGLMEAFEGSGRRFRWQKPEGKDVNLPEVKIPHLPDIPDLDLSQLQSGGPAGGGGWKFPEGLGGDRTSATNTLGGSGADRSERLQDEQDDRSVRRLASQQPNETVTLPPGIPTNDASGAAPTRPAQGLPGFETALVTPRSSNVTAPDVNTGSAPDTAPGTAAAPGTSSVPDTADGSAASLGGRTAPDTADIADIAAQESGTGPDGEDEVGLQALLGLPPARAAFDPAQLPDPSPQALLPGLLAAPSEAIAVLRPQVRRGINELSGIARGAGLPEAGWRQQADAAGEAARTGNWGETARRLEALRTAVEHGLLDRRLAEFRSHVEGGFARLEELGVREDAWRTRVDAVEQAARTGEVVLTDSALREYTAFVERHLPVEVLNRPDAPRSFDAGVERLRRELTAVGDPAERQRLREELALHRELRERLDRLAQADLEASLMLRRLIGQQEAAATPEEAARARQALEEYQRDRDLGRQLDEVRAGAGTGDLDQRLDALRDAAAPDPRGQELRQRVEDAATPEEREQALGELAAHHQLTAYERRLDALREVVEPEGGASEAAAQRERLVQQVVDARTPEEARQAGQALKEFTDRQVQEQRQRLVDRLHTAADARTQAQDAALRRRLDDATTEEKRTQTLHELAGHKQAQLQQRVDNATTDRERTKALDEQSRFNNWTPQERRLAELRMGLLPGGALEADAHRAELMREIENARSPEESRRAEQALKEHTDRQIREQQQRLEERQQAAEIHNDLERRLKIVRGQDPDAAPAHDDPLLRRFEELRGDGTHQDPREAELMRRMESAANREEAATARQALQEYLSTRERQEREQEQERLARVQAHEQETALLREQLTRQQRTGALDDAAETRRRLEETHARLDELRTEDENRAALRRELQQEIDLAEQGADSSGSGSGSGGRLDRLVGEGTAARAEQERARIREELEYLRRDGDDWSLDELDVLPSVPGTRPDGQPEVPAARNDGEPEASAARAEDATSPEDVSGAEDAPGARPVGEDDAAAGFLAGLEDLPSAPLSPLAQFGEVAGPRPAEAPAPAQPTHGRPSAEQPGSDTAQLQAARSRPAGEGDDTALPKAPSGAAHVDRATMPERVPRVEDLERTLAELGNDTAAAKPADEASTPPPESNGVQPEGARTDAATVTDAAAVADPVTVPGQSPVEARLRTQVTPELRRFAERLAEPGREAAAQRLWSEAAKITQRHNPFPVTLGEGAVSLLQRDPEQFWNVMRVAQALHAFDGYLDRITRGVAEARVLAEQRGVSREVYGILAGDNSGERERGTGSAAYHPVDDARQALRRHLAAQHDAAGPSSLMEGPSSGRDFDFVEREGGHEVVYRPLGVRTKFSGPEHEVVYRETVPVLGPPELRRLRIAVSFTPTEQGGRTARYELIGSSEGTGRFEVGAAPDELRTHRQADFSVLDRESGVRLHYAADGSLVASDQPLADGRGQVRLDMVRPSTAPQALDPSGTPSAAFREEPLGVGQVALIPHAVTDDPREPIVVDTEIGSLTEGTAAAPADSAEARSGRTDHSQGTAWSGDDLRDESDAAAARDEAENAAESGVRRAAADAAREESDTTGSTAESSTAESSAGGSASFSDAELAARAARVLAEGRALIEGQLPVDAPTAFDRVVTGDAGEPLDIVQAERLIADAREEAVRRGADPAVLHAGVVALRNAAYWALVDDAWYAVQEFVRSPGRGGVEDQGFTVTPRPDDGHAVLHVSGLGMEFDAGQRWTSREFLLGDAPASMGNVTVVVGRTWDGGEEVLSYRLAGDSRGVARFDVTPIADDSPDAPFGRFMATDALTGDRYLFGGDGTHTVHDVPVGGGSVRGESGWDGWAYVRREMGAVDEEPRLVDADSRPWDGWRVQTLSPISLALIPPGAAPEQRLVIDERGRLDEEIAPLRDESGRLTGYARIDHPITLPVPVEHLDSRGRQMVVGHGDDGTPIVTYGLTATPIRGGGLLVVDIWDRLFERPPLGLPRPDNTVGNPHVIPAPPLREMLMARIPGDYSSLRLAAFGDGPLRLQSAEGEEVQAEFVRDGDGLTVRTPVPDAPDGIMAEHRLAADGTLLRSEVPLGVVGEDGQPLAAILIRHRSPDAGDLSTLELGGGSGSGDRYTLKGTMTDDGEIWFWLTDNSTGIPRLYQPGGVLEHMRIPFDRRYSLVQSVHGSRVLSSGDEDFYDHLALRGLGPRVTGLGSLRAEPVDGGLVAIRPTAWDGRPEGGQSRAETVVDIRTGRVVEETLAVLDDAGVPAGYFRIDYRPDRGEVTALDASGREIDADRGRYRLVSSPDGREKLVVDRRDGMVRLDRGKWDLATSAPAATREPLRLENLLPGVEVRIERSPDGRFLEGTLAGESGLRFAYRVEAVPVRLSAELFLGYTLINKSTGEALHFDAANRLHSREAPEPRTDTADGPAVEGDDSALPKAPSGAAHVDRATMPERVLRVEGLERTLAELENDTAAAGPADEASTPLPESNDVQPEGAWSASAGHPGRGATTPAARVLLASNRGPVSFSRSEEGTLTVKRGSGGLVSGLSAIDPELGAVWVCAALSEGDREATRGRSYLDLEVTGGQHVRMLDIDAATFADAYNGIANSTLWFVHHLLYQTPPVFDHPLYQTPPVFDQAFRAQWTSYEAYNTAFADALATDAAPGAAVLVQDYHLTLTPGLLRERRPDLRIGHFSHTPWAPPNDYRLLPDDIAAQVLRGILGADRAAFLTHRWARAFVDCCAEVLGAEVHTVGGELAVTHEGRTTRIGVHGLGVDADFLHERSRRPDVEQRLEELREEIGEGRKVIVRVDRTDLSKNIIRGLTAYRRLLQTHPEWHGRVVHVAIEVLSRQDVALYREYVAEVQRLGDEINSEFGHAGWKPLILLIVKDDFPGALAAYRMADVALVNPTRDGMNLVAKEVPIVSDEGCALVLSRAAGAFAELGDDVIGIDPFDTEGTARALHEALTLGTRERAVRTERLAAAAAALPPTRWFLEQLEALEQGEGAHPATQELSRFAERFGKVEEEAAGRLWDEASRITAEHNPFDLTIGGPGESLLQHNSEQYWATMRVAQVPHQNADAPDRREQAVAVARGLARQRGVSAVREGLLGGSWNADTAPPVPDEASTSRQASGVVHPSQLTPEQRDVSFGPPVDPDARTGVHIKPEERDDAGDLRVNPLWTPLEEVDPRILTGNREPAAKWLYTVTEDGRVVLGSETVSTLMGEQQFLELLAAMREKNPALTEEELRSSLDGVGPPSVAVGSATDSQSGSSGHTLIGPARITGVLRWDAERGSWTVNDRSGRYMKTRFRPDAPEPDVTEWLGNIARLFSEHFGVEVVPVRKKSGQAPVPGATGTPSTSRPPRAVPETAPASVGQAGPPVPEGTSREVPLSVPGLDELHLRISEAEAPRDGSVSLPGQNRTDRVDVAEGAETSQALTHLELVDATTGAPVPGRQVLPRPDGGYTVLDTAGNFRWELAPDGSGQARDLRLPGTDVFLRQDLVGARMRGIVDRAGAPAGGGRFAIQRIPGASGAPGVAVRTLRDGVSPGQPAASWRYDGDGTLLETVLPVTGDDLDPALRGTGVRIARESGTGGFTLRLVDASHDPVRSLVLRPLDGRLARRFLGGFSLTDTVTGDRYVLDAKARQVLPREVSPEDVDSAEAFARTVSEAAGERTPPGGAATDLSDRADVLYLLAVVPEEPESEVPGIELLPRLTERAFAALDRTDFDPGTLRDIVRQLAERSLEVMRQGATTALNQYLKLPRAERMADLAASRSAGGRVFGDFTVISALSGPGGSRYLVTHNPSGLRTGYAPDRSRVYREVFLLGGPENAAGLIVGMTGRQVEGSWQPRSVELAAGSRASGERFSLDMPDSAVSGTPDVAFTLTDAAGGARWHYSAEGVPSRMVSRHVTFDGGTRRLSADQVSVVDLVAKDVVRAGLANARAGRPLPTFVITGHSNGPTVLGRPYFEGAMRLGRERAEAVRKVFTERLAAHLRQAQVGLSDPIGAEAFRVTAESRGRDLPEGVSPQGGPVALRRAVITVKFPPGDDTPPPARPDTGPDGTPPDSTGDGSGGRPPSAGTPRTSPGDGVRTPEQQPPGQRGGEGGTAESGTAAGVDAEAGGKATGESHGGAAEPSGAADSPVRRLADWFGKLEEQTAGRLWGEASRITAEHNLFDLTIGGPGESLLQHNSEQYWATMRVAQVPHQNADAPDRREQAVAVARGLARQRGVSAVREGLLGGSPDVTAAGPSRAAGSATESDVPMTETDVPMTQAALGSEAGGAAAFAEAPGLMRVLYTDPAYVPLALDFEKRLAEYAADQPRAREVAQIAVNLLFEVFAGAHPDLDEEEILQIFRPDDPMAVDHVEEDDWPATVDDLVERDVPEVMAALHQAALVSDSPLALPALLRGITGRGDWARAEQLGLDVRALREGPRAVPPTVRASRTAAELGHILRVLNLADENGDGEGFALALVAWLLPRQEESLYEVLAGLRTADVVPSLAGNALEEAARMYRSIPGLTLEEVREEIAADGLLPHEAVYWAKIQDGRFAEPSKATRREAEKRREDFAQLVGEPVDTSALADSDNWPFIERWLFRNDVAPEKVLERLSLPHFVALMTYTETASQLMNAVLKFGPAEVQPALRKRVRQIIDERYSTSLTAITLLSSDPAAKALLAADPRDLTQEENARQNDELYAIAERLLPAIEREMTAHSAMLLDALEQLPPVTGVVWRSQRSAQKLFEGTGHGDPAESGRSEFSFPTFASFSRQKDVASDLMWRDSLPTDWPVLVRAELTGHWGRDISAFSTSQEEDEVLLLPGARLKIESRSLEEGDQGGYERIDVREVAPPSYELLRFEVAFGKLELGYAAELWAHAADITAQHNPFGLTVIEGAGSLREGDSEQYWATMRVVQELHENAGAPDRVARAVTVAKALGEERNVSASRPGLRGGAIDTPSTSRPPRAVPETAPASVGQAGPSMPAPVEQARPSTLASVEEEPTAGQAAAWRTATDAENEEGRLGESPASGAPIAGHAATAVPEEALDLARAEQLVVDSQAGLAGAGVDSGDYARAVQQRADLYEKLLRDAAGATRKWLDASGQSQEAHVDGFTVASLEEGGIAAVHDATGLRTTFELVDGAPEWASREFRVVGAPPETASLKVVVERGAESGRLRRDLAGKPRVGTNARFSAEPVSESGFRGEWLTIVDHAYGHGYVVDATAVLVRRLVQMDGGVGRLLYDVTRPGEAPAVLDENDMPSQNWSASLLDGGRVKLMRPGTPVGSIEHLEVDALTGKLLKETVAIHDQRDRITGFWEIDHQSSSAVRLNEAGSAVRVNKAGRPVARGGSSKASVVTDPEGGLQVLRGPKQGSTLLFARPPLGDVMAYLLARDGLRVGRESFVFRVGWPGGDRSVRVDAPLGAPEALRLVDQHSGERIDMPVDFRRYFGLTVEVAVPGARKGTKARYDFTRTGKPRSEKLPLVGGEDAALGDLRLEGAHDSRMSKFVLGGPAAARERFSLGELPENMKAVPEADFTVTDSPAPVRYHFSRGARLVAQDVPLGLGAAGERVLDSRESLLLRLGEDREPELVGPRGPLAGDLVLRTEALNEGRMAVIRTDAAGQEEARLVVDTASGRVLEEHVPVPGERARRLGSLVWKLDFPSGTAVRLGDDGEPAGGPLDHGLIEVADDGRLRVVRPGGDGQQPHVLFERRGTTNGTNGSVAWLHPEDPGAHAPAEAAAHAPASRADLARLAFQREAERFERRLGAYLVRQPRVREEIAKYSRIVWDRFSLPDRSGFGSDNPSTVGGVGTDYNDLRAVAYDGNIREQTALLRQALQHGLFRQYLGEAAELDTVDPAKLATELDFGRLWRHFKSVVPDPRRATYPDVVPLSERERAFTDDGRRWKSGGEAYGTSFLPLSEDKPGEDGQRMPFDAKTFERGPHATAQATGGLIMGGASRTTWLLLRYAEAANRVWDAGLDLRYLRLALVGTMLQAGAHSLHEILLASAVLPRDAVYRALDLLSRDAMYRALAEVPGFAYDHDNWERYRHLAPLTERELREHVTPEGLFPDELVRGPGVAAYDPVDDARQALTDQLGGQRGRGADRDFTITVVDGGHEVVHRPTGLVTRFRGERHEVVYHEAVPGFGSRALRGLKVAVEQLRQEDARLAPRYRLLGEPEVVDRFEIREAPRDLRRGRKAAFSVLEKDTGRWLHYLADGRVIAKDQPVEAGFGYLRFDMFHPGGEPTLLDTVGQPSTRYRVEGLGGERVALVPAGSGAAGERIVVGAEDGRRLEEIVAAPDRHGELPGSYWKFDYRAGIALRADGDGRTVAFLGGRFDHAQLESTDGGGVRVVLPGQEGVAPRVLFEWPGAQQPQSARREPGYARETPVAESRDDRAALPAPGNATGTPQSGVQPGSSLRRFAERFGKLEKQTARRLWGEAVRVVAAYHPFRLTLGEPGAGLLGRDPERYWATMRVARVLHQYEGAPDRRDRAVAVAKALGRERNVSASRPGLRGGATDTPSTSRPPRAENATGSGPVIRDHPLSADAPTGSGVPTSVTARADQPISRDDSSAYSPSEAPTAKRLADGQAQEPGTGASLTPQQVLERVVRADPGGLHIGEVKGLLAKAKVAAQQLGHDARMLHGTLREIRARAYQAMLDDARRALLEVLGGARNAPDGERVVGDWRIIPTESGHFYVAHVPTALRARFDGKGEWTHQERFLGEAPAFMRGLKVLVSRGPGTPLGMTYQLMGPQILTSRFSVGAAAGAGQRGGFSVAVKGTGGRFLFGAEGTLLAVDVRLEGGPSRLSYDMGQQGGGFRVVGPSGRVVEGMRAVPVSGGRVAVLRAGDTGAVREHSVFAADSGKLLEETVQDQWNRSYWRIDYSTGVAVPLADSGHVRPGIRALVHLPGDGRVRLVNPAGVLLHARPTTAEGVRVGGVTPRITEESLYGMERLAGYRLRLTEMPQTVVAPASRKVQVIDRAGIPVPEALVRVDSDGGFRVTGFGGVVGFDPGGRFRYRDLTLPGSVHTLRLFSPTGLDGDTQVLDPAQQPLQSVRLARDPQGLTVGLPVHGAPDGAMAQWRFDKGGQLVRQETPLTGHSAFEGLHVGVNHAPTGKTFELVGPSDRTGPLSISPPTADSPGRADGFTLTDTTTGNRFHFTADHTLAVTGVRLERNLGTLRFDHTREKAPDLLDADEELVESLGVALTKDGRVTLFPEEPLAERPLENLVVDPATGRVDEEIVATLGGTEEEPGRYWQLDHRSGRAFRLDADGHVLTGQSDTARIERLSSGETRLLVDDTVVHTIPNRLAAAADQSVNVHAIAPRPVWRETTEPLYRFDNRGPDTIFTEGFTPLDPLETGLHTYVDINNSSAFVGTTTDKNLAFSEAYKYEIHVPGGIDINSTLAIDALVDEQEIAFPGGIHTRYIKGVWRNNSGDAYPFSEGEWIDNPHFDPGLVNDTRACAMRLDSLGAASQTQVADAGTEPSDLEPSNAPAEVSDPEGADAVRTPEQQFPGRRGDEGDAGLSYLDTVTWSDTSPP